jgi:hypothetical protein
MGYSLWHNAMGGGLVDLSDEAVRRYERQHRQHGDDAARSLRVRRGNGRAIMVYRLWLMRCVGAATMVAAAVMVALVTTRSAAREAAISRVYAGIHFPFGSQQGLVQGHCIGQVILDRLQFTAPGRGPW